MPWDARRPGGGADGGPEGVGPARSRAQKQCRKSSFAFYQAVRDLLPVWLLEDMRASEAFHWDERGRATAYSPSEALLYALVHDHQAYAHYLLATFPRRALAPPSAGFRCCAAPGPHVALAVRYNRVGVLRRILRAVRDFPAEERARLLDRRGCSRVEGGGTALHVACELARPECLFLLLGHGASPGLRNADGLTPLELLLRQLGHDSSAGTVAGAPGATGPGEPRQRRLLLLDLLALYTPTGAAGPTRRELLGDRLRWQRLLGEDKFQWLAGLAPPSLFARAMQVLVTAISPGRFPEALDELPLPPFLQPLDLTGKG
ncbi:ankyrin repeat domain-containing protein 9 [Loxodonta africana]|uniref:Ankyrin repeat domain-containing protein 9 n=1 Tax=Loxodonta africana TaxID=9785 RepID=G3TCI5_LOXAF|nr:ankyrin repeat domain-containing protein 9 isoform X2 [Loxodonta africana]XP_010587128.1 ankyrin repeat domain-containing protein 9 isoform X2 [Loxodonta africana]XP_010587129.1 ankyrin repeat domain-containing protein 9 isoform X2 [Loxodonta africana]